MRYVHQVQQDIKPRVIVVTSTQGAKVIQYLGLHFAELLSRGDDGKPIGIEGQIEYYYNNRIFVYKKLVQDNPSMLSDILVMLGQESFDWDKDLEIDVRPHLRCPCCSYMVRSVVSMLAHMGTHGILHHYAQQFRWNDKGEIVSMPMAISEQVGKESTNMRLLRPGIMGRKGPTVMNKSKGPKITTFKEGKQIVELPELPDIPGLSKDKDKKTKSKSKAKKDVKEDKKELNEFDGSYQQSGFVEACPECNTTLEDKKYKKTEWYKLKKNKDNVKNVRKKLENNGLVSCPKCDNIFTLKSKTMIERLTKVHQMVR